MGLWNDLQGQILGQQWNQLSRYYILILVALQHIERLK